MKRSPIQQYSLYAAWLFGIAPFVFGLIRALTTGDDYRFLWMSLAPSFFVAGLLATSMGRRRTRKAVRVQTTIIFVVATILAMITAPVFGVTALSNSVGISAMYGALLAMASVMVARSRTRDHH